MPLATILFATVVQDMANSCEELKVLLILRSAASCGASRRMAASLWRAAILRDGRASKSAVADFDI
jgi:hypothetical protein